MNVTTGEPDRTARRDDVGERTARRDGERRRDDHDHDDHDDHDDHETTITTTTIAVVGWLHSFIHSINQSVSRSV